MSLPSVPETLRQGSRSHWEEEKSTPGTESGWGVPQGDPRVHSLSLAGFVPLVVAFCCCCCLLCFGSVLFFLMKPLPDTFAASPARCRVLPVLAWGDLLCRQIRLPLQHANTFAAVPLQVGAEQQRQRRSPPRQPRSHPAAGTRGPGLAPPARSPRAWARIAGQGPPSAALRIHPLSAFLLVLLLENALQG